MDKFCISSSVYGTPEHMEAMGPRKYDLQDRFDWFAARIVNYVDPMPKTMSGKYYVGQLLRSGGSPALHYGEASGAESTNDVVHKLRIALKELKESRSNLKIHCLSGLIDHGRRPPMVYQGMLGADRDHRQKHRYGTKEPEWKVTKGCPTQQAFHLKIDH